MAIPLLSLLGGPIKGLVESVGGVIDKLSTSQDEKNQAKIELYKLQTSFLTQMEASASEFAKQQASIIIAEASGESWLQRNWRPVLMLTFTFVIAWNFVVSPIVGAFGVTLQSVPLPDHMWELLKIGVGGYIVARSGEKIMESYATNRPSAGGNK